MLNKLAVKFWNLVKTFINPVFKYFTNKTDLLIQKKQVRYLQWSASVFMFTPVIVVDLILLFVGQLA